jgi:hypothetical protein
MFKIILATSAGIVLGYFVVPKVVGIAGIGPDATAARAPGLAPAARMAQDVRYMCRQLDPMLRTLETSLADRRLSVGEGAYLYSQVQGLL